VRIPFGQATAVGRPFIDLDPEITVAILRTIVAGWEIAQGHPEVHLDAKEVPITECLRDGMREALRVRRWPWRMIVAPGTESRSRAGMTYPDGRTDIPLFLIEIFLQWDEHDPHAIIECKRVAESDAALSREYIIEGMDRFRTGKYGENHGKGFMAGYILSGTPLRVVEGINSYLGHHGRDTERLEPSAFSNLDGIWTSRHPRMSIAKTIELHHAMLVIAPHKAVIVD
jgi:hypothetical protein